MPTGYTSDIYEGKAVTFKDFALKCARAMGAGITQRDEPGDNEIHFQEIDDFYYKKVQNAKADLSRALSRSVDYWEEQQRREIAEAIKYRDDYLENQDNLRSRYDHMLNEVRNWVPPTSEHDGLKKFMIEQLESSIEFDTGGSYTPSVPEEKDVATYADEKIAVFAKSLQYAVESLTKQEDLARSQRAWVTALRDSLEE
jgi:hypothetical protein